MISRIAEETLPFAWYYLCSLPRIEASLERNAEQSRSDVAETLDPEQWAERLTDEHSRTIRLDGKADRCGLVALGLSVPALVVFLISANPFVGMVASVSLIHFLFALLMCMGSMRPAPTYGVGTAFMASPDFPEAIIGQQNSNLIRQCRNEAAYQTARNGLILLSLAVVLA